MNSRKTRLVLAIVAAVAVFGYKTLHHTSDADSGKTVAG